jgi:hypothetical protein
MFVRASAAQLAANHCEPDLKRRCWQPHYATGKDMNTHSFAYVIILINQFLLFKRLPEENTSNPFVLVEPNISVAIPYDCDKL